MFNHRINTFSLVKSGGNALLRSNMQILSNTIAREMAIAETFLYLSYLNYMILSARTEEPQPWKFCAV